jgi:hypothetical protein
MVRDCAYSSGGMMVIILSLGTSVLITVIYRDYYYLLIRPY